MKQVRIVELGRTPYRSCWQLQQRLFDLRSNNAIGDLLLLTEHEPVYTIGTTGDHDHLLANNETIRALGADVMQVDRGGDITFHGPGQLVGYPILHLSDYREDLHWYLRQLEEVVLRSLTRLGITGRRDPDYTGVWVGQDKVCAIGVKSRRWVTMHGFALNVATDLSFFRHIIPCGIFERGVTSVSEVLRREVDVPSLFGLVTEEFASVFNVTLVPTTLMELEQTGEAFQRTAAERV